MEENYYPHRKSNLTFLFLTAISIFFMTARLTEYIHGFKNLLFYILSPIPTVTANAIYTNQKLARNIKDIIKAHQENRVLRSKIERYVQQEREWMQEKKENVRLRNLVGFVSPYPSKKVIARVVSREPNSWFQWVIVNKGRDNGITLDLPVLVWEGDALCVLGRIGEVYKESSKVILITNALAALPAMLNSNNEDGLIEGQNNYLLRLNYLISKKHVSVGDAVVSSPLSSVLPPGMLIGHIQDFIPSEDERFHSLLVKPAVPLNSLREVVILVKEKR